MSPLIDEHNRTSQNILGLEKKLLTKDWRVFLLTVASGLRVVDAHRRRRNKKHKETPMELARTISKEVKMFEIEHDYEI